MIVFILLVVGDTNSANSKALKYFNFPFLSFYRNESKKLSFSFLFESKGKVKVPPLKTTIFCHQNVAQIKSYQNV
jgi:hypothetical protein